jgi:hypothetical protein
MVRHAAVALAALLPPLQLVVGAVVAATGQGQGQGAAVLLLLLLLLLRPAPTALFHLGWWGAASAAAHAPWS